MKKRIIAAGLGLYIAGAGAGVYKCVGANGETTFQQEPCPGAQEQTELTTPSGSGNASSSEDQKNFVIAKSDLIGTWSDQKIRTPLSSSWTFTSTTMTFKKFNGRTITAPYTLKSDRLIVHHEKSPVNNGPWDEEMNLVSYKNGILVWDSVTRVKLYKMF